MRWCPESKFFGLTYVICSPVWLLMPQLPSLEVYLDGLSVTRDWILPDVSCRLQKLSRGSSVLWWPDLTSGLLDDWRPVITLWRSEMGYFYFSNPEWLKTTDDFVELDLQSASMDRWRNPRRGKGHGQGVSLWNERKILIKLELRLGYATASSSQIMPSGPDAWISHSKNGKYFS